METTKSKILEIFRAFKVGKEEYLPTGSLRSSVEKLERNHQDNLTKALDELIEEGHLKILDSPAGYVLTETGYNILYDEQ